MVDQLDKDVFLNTAALRKQYHESCKELGISPSKKLEPVVIGRRSVPEETLEGDK